jgi:hypothetical protein
MVKCLASYLFGARQSECKLPDLPLFSSMVLGRLAPGLMFLSLLICEMEIITFILTITMKHKKQPRLKNSAADISV